MIKKGGINISPAEVEDMLMQHPAVSQAGVVGIPDPRQGELLTAFIVLRPAIKPVARTSPSIAAPPRRATSCRTSSSSARNCRSLPPAS